MAYICIQTGPIFNRVQKTGGKEVECLNKKWLFALFLALAVAASLLFLKWLYSPDPYLSKYDISSTGSAEVFNYDIKKRLKLEEYSNNFYIQLLNTVMTGAKANYEIEYGCPMPGLLESAASSITDGLHTGAGNPITYLNFAFTAFSQYDPSLFSYAETGSSAFPNITDFENAPQGAIYFSEEDEYKAEIPAETPASQIVEEAVAIPGKIALNSKSPQILVYHSHSTESYMPNTAGNYHTQNDKYNVIAVGSIFAKELQDKY